jgi:hypothetical protein
MSTANFAKQKISITNVNVREAGGSVTEKLIELEVIENQQS